jgi:hypothetical protein
METAASLTNHLMAALRNSKTGTLSTAEISNVFKNVQEQREERVSELVKASHARQRLECMETPLLKFLGRFVLPYLPRHVLLNRWITTYSPAVSLNMLPMPRTPRDVAYFDERFRTPYLRGVFGLILYAAFFFLAWMGHRQLWTAGKINGTWNFVREAVQSQSVSLPGGLDVPLRQVYTGLGPVDRILQTLVTVFLPVVANISRPEQPLQGLYFLASLLPVIAILTVEGYRPRNRWTLLASPALWGIMYQLRGIGLIAPLYFATSLFHSSSVSYFTPSSRRIPESTAKAVIPGLVLGFVLPTMMMFFPLQNSFNTRQIFIALWQPTPVYVAILTETLSRAFKCIGPSTGVKTNTNGDGVSDHDLPHLRVVYATVGSISACFHLALILCWVSSGTEFIARAFLPFDSLAQVSNLADGVFVFFQNDFLLVAVATMLWCLTNAWDLYRVGISNVSWRIVSLAIILGCIVVGPGATVAAVWYWREEVLSRTSFNQHPPISS